MFYGSSCHLCNIGKPENAFITISTNVYILHVPEGAQQGKGGSPELMFAGVVNAYK